MKETESLDAFIKEIMLLPLVEDMMKENEAKLYLRKSRREYEDFLAQVISTKISTSCEQVRRIIDSINLREEFENKILPRYLLKQV